MPVMNDRARASRRALRFSIIWGVLFAGCAHQPLTPEIASSAQETSYARAHPYVLEQERQQLVNDKTAATERTAALRDQDVRADVDGKWLKDVLETASEAGQSRAFVDAQREARAFRAFFEEERGPIAARISAAAQKQISEHNCQDVEVGGAVSYALRDSFDRQLDKRVRERNQAQHMIEEQRGKLPNPSLHELSELADDVAYASYLVHVALIDDKTRIDALLDERRDVASTLDDAIKREQKGLEGATSKEEKRAREERLSALEKSRAALDVSVKDAEAEVRELEQTIRQADADYEDALAALIKRVEQRKPRTAAK